MASLPRQNTYWICQIAGWGGMVLIEMINYSFFIVRKFSISVLLVFLICAVLGIVLTHIYRIIIRKRSLFSSSLRYIWFYAFVSTLVISILFTLLTEIPLMLMNPGGWKNFTFINIGGSVVNWARYVGVWIIIYFLYQILGQHNRIQQEKLSFESQARTTELELLKTQLNPHFLFNALNSIKALVIINPEQSREAIVTLSELLRFTLQYGKERFIPLDLEVGEAEKYLSLEQMRFGQRLSVNWDIEPAARKVLVPPALILTLVENAVKHGVAKNMGNGIVHTTIRLTGEDQLSIQIRNTGSYEPGADTGIGLKHVTRRLEELYNGQAAFSIQEKAGSVVTTLNLPVKWQ